MRPLTKDKWVDDQAAEGCQRCKKVFGLLFRRRHHCRYCGWLVCAPCSGHRLVFRLDADPVRVCERCLHRIIGRIDALYDRRYMRAVIGSSGTSPPATGSQLSRRSNGSSSGAGGGGGRGCSNSPSTSNFWTPPSSQASSPADGGEGPSSGGGGCDTNKPEKDEETQSENGDDVVVATFVASRLTVTAPNEDDDEDDEDDDDGDGTSGSGGPSSDAGGKDQDDGSSSGTAAGRALSPQPLGALQKPQTTPGELAPLSPFSAAIPRWTRSVSSGDLEVGLSAMPKTLAFACLCPSFPASELKFGAVPLT